MLKKPSQARGINTHNHYGKSSVRKNVPYSLIRYAITVISVFFVVLFVSFFFRQKNLPANCANSISCINDLSVRVENDEIGIFQGQNVLPPRIDLSYDDAGQNVLGETEEKIEKRIEVDLSKQKLYAYKKNMLVMETFISSGKWFPTPTGTFRIWVKLRSTRMSGGQGDSYYDLPNVPYVMFFYNKEYAKYRGFGLHGAYWHNNFGNPMSHGCVNMRIVDAEALYNFVNARTNDDPGTQITIYGKAPVY